MMEEMGYCMAKYDPFFFPDPAVLDKQYDFVTCTEAIEHFYFPDREWKQLVGLVKPGGWLGIMTKLVTEETPFTDWYYAGDPTHVCFFSRETFRFLGESDDLQVSFRRGIVWSFYSGEFDLSINPDCPLSIAMQPAYNPVLQAQLAQKLLPT